MNKSNARPLTILKHHYKRIGQPFEVQYLKGKVAKPRVMYPDGDMNMIEICNQRQILPDEIVIDLDGETTLENGELMKEAEYRLNMRGYSYECWSTGSKGLHYHLFFPELLPLTEEQRKYIKAKFLSLFRDLKADQLMKSEKRMVNLENASHRKTLRPKSLLHVKEGKRHKIPSKWISEAHRVEHRPLCVKRIKTNGHLHPSAKKLLNATLTDGRKRIAFYLAAHLRNAYGDKDKVLELLLQWNELQTKKQTEYKLKSTVNSVFNSNETPGQRYLEDIMYGVEYI